MIPSVKISWNRTTLIGILFLSARSRSEYPLIGQYEPSLLNNGEGLKACCQDHALTHPGSSCHSLLKFPTSEDNPLPPRLRRPEPGAAETKAASGAQAGHRPPSFPIKKSIRKSTRVVLELRVRDLSAHLRTSSAASRKSRWEKRGPDANVLRPCLSAFQKTTNIHKHIYIYIYNPII